ncbi:hypothetical protein [Flavobacterium columnare]|uniref:hypothetical protein n=1 Tax=Flavobacterium columnare TaxID=996 RepID=UPI002989C68B|nr:hypothetical protein [Flavobacterium columnare]MCH4831092.1 hypothetical protein [Flavobacterium columnare]
MIKIVYFKFQFKLFNRQLKEFGISPQLIYTLLIVGFGLISNYLFKITTYAPLIYLLFSFNIYLSEKQKILYH